MKVRLFNYSGINPEMTNEYDGRTLEDLIAYCARVSNPSNQHNVATGSKLIKYLAKHKHWSPFEMVSVCMELETTRDIARQMLRHRSFSFQEFSQRYADPTKDLDFVIREARLQDPKNRQNSIASEDDNLQKAWMRRQLNVITEATMAYNWAIENGVAKEQARVVLPEGNTVSRLYVNGTVRSWIHYCQVRTGIETQKEHRLLAEACAFELAKVFPIMADMISTAENQ